MAAYLQASRVEFGGQVLSSQGEEPILALSFEL